jgi:hypothetical protein
MKQGIQFEELVAQVNREAEARRDYYCPTSEMHMMSDASGSRLATPSGQFGVRDMAHLHMAELCGIDRRYYQKVRTDAPHLLDRNVNHWLTTSTPKRRIVRALDSEARAIVSSRYAMLDNDALLQTMEPVIDELGLTVESCDVSDEKLLIKMVSPRLTGEVKVGDHVQAGIMVRNSEVRCSAVEVDWFVKRLVCTNGMVVNGLNGRGAFRRHVGRDWDAPRRTPNGAKPLPLGLIPETIEREEWERAIWQQLQASLRESLNTDAFTALLERLSLTTTLHSLLEPDAIVERVGRVFGLHPAEHSKVLYHLIRDEDLSLWGVLNAVTRTAEDVDDYNRATELEELGGRMAHLTPREWERLVSPN